MPDLFGNQPDASWTWQNASFPDIGYGSRFQVTAAGEITRVGYYRAGTGAAFNSLSLWGAAGALLWQTLSPADSGAVGWQWSTVTPPVAVTTGVTYAVSGGLAGDRWRAINNTPSTRAAPPSPFIFDDTALWTALDGEAYPATADNTRYMSPSVTFGAGPPPDPGPGEGDPTLTGDVNSWLSANPAVQTHETDGLPWLTKLVADAIKNGQDVAKIVIDATKASVDLIPKAGDSNWTIVSKLWQIAGVLTEAEIDLWNLFAKRAPHQLTGPTPGGGSAFFGPSGGQVAERAEVAGFNSELLWHRTETTNWLDSVPGGDWVLEDTLTWDASFAWNQRADAYVLHITSWPVWADQQDVAGSLWLPRAAWWAPLTGTLPHERHFADLEYQVLHALPMRCEGILFCPRPGFAGTLEAWVRPLSAPLPESPF